MFSGILKKSAAEACGTFVFMLIGCGAIRLHALQPDAMPAMLIPALFGLAICVMIFTLGPVSGAHFNPAVTAAFAVTGRFPLRQMPWYWAAQSLGALLAMAIISWFLPETSVFGRTQPALPLLQAFALELLLSFILMLVITAVATDSRVTGTRAGLAIGMTVAFCAYAGGPLTGASMNPVRSLAPALFENRLEHLWLYFAGPLAGTILAAFFYEWLRSCDDASTRKQAKGCC